MGIVLNPLALRIGYSQSWSDSWFLNLSEYVEFYFNLLYVKNLIYFIFYRFFSTRKLNWLFSHVEISIKNNILFLNVFLYEAFSFGVIGSFMLYLKYRLFKKLRLKTFWMKKFLFDRNIIACLYFFYISYAFHNYNLEKFNFFKNAVFDIDLMKKIRYLRSEEKYKKNWMGQEELEIMRIILFFFRDGIVPYSAW